jgi:hypothetical protein
LETPIAHSTVPIETTSVGHPGMLSPPVLTETAPLTYPETTQSAETPSQLQSSSNNQSTFLMIKRTAFI